MMLYFSIAPLTKALSFSIESKSYIVYLKIWLFYNLVTFSLETQFHSLIELCLKTDLDAY